MWFLGLQSQMKLWRITNTSMEPMEPTVNLLNAVSWDWHFLANLPMKVFSTLILFILYSSNFCICLLLLTNMLCNRWSIFLYTYEISLSYLVTFKRKLWRLQMSGLHRKCCKWGWAVFLSALWYCEMLRKQSETMITVWAKVQK